MPSLPPQSHVSAVIVNPSIFPIMGYSLTSKFLGETLNIMTLGALAVALAVALGLVIDDGIVVVENMFIQLEQGRSRLAAIASGLHTITPAMIGSSITTMAAFLPLTFLGGVTGQFFAPLAIVMVATLFVSLMLALFLTPLLADYLFPNMFHPHSEAAHTPSRVQKVLLFFPAIFDKVAAWYQRFFVWSLNHSLVILLMLVPIMLGTYGLFTHVQTGFFPEFDEGAFVIDYKMPAGTSLQETNLAALQVENVLGKTPEVAAWSRLTGALSGSGLELTEQNEGDILVRLKKQRSRSANDIMSALRSKIEGAQPKLQVDFAQMLQDGIGDIAGSPSPIEVKIFGDNMEKLVALAHQAGNIISSVPGVVDEDDGVIDSGPEMMVRVNGANASRYGLTTNDVSSAAQAALRGTVATAIQQGEQSIDVRVRGQQPPGSVDEQTLPNVPIAAPALKSTFGAPNSGTVPLSDVASLQLHRGTPLITRENQQQMFAVTARLEGRDLGSAMKDVQTRITQKLNLPPGYYVEYGGLYASQQQSFAQLGMVLMLAFLLVTTLLVIQFRSFRQALALFVAAILSLFGVLLGLFITRAPLNLSSFTGAIMIVGIVTENGIVLFDFFNHSRVKNPEMSLIEAMANAGQMRLRPILMTTLAAILALFPLALGLGAGAAMQKPLAIAVIGGLSSAIFFTLVVAPVLYVASERLKGSFTRRLTFAEDDFDAIEQELARE